MKSFKVDHKSSIPLHAQIEEYLRGLIKKAKYKNGVAFLPKEVALSNTFGVSRNTIRQAISKLVQEGLIERKKGVGTRVIQKRIATRLDNWISFTKEMRNQGIEVVNYMVKITQEKADDKLAEIFMIPKTKEIWKLEKTRGSKEAKYLYSVSYFHPRVGITGNENFNKPLYELLEEDHHIIANVSKEKLKAIKSDKNISKLLKIKIGEPLLKRERLVCDFGNRPIEYNIVFYNTDYFSYDIDIKRE